MSAAITAAMTAQAKRQAGFEAAEAAALFRPARAPTEALLTVASARAMLKDTSRLPDDQIEAAQRVIRSFTEARPRGSCAVCYSYKWSEHVDAAGEPVWACEACHRSPMAAEAVNAMRAAECDRMREAIAADPPNPRDDLKEAHEKLHGIRANLTRLEAAAARAWVQTENTAEARTASEATNADLRLRGRDKRINALLDGKRTPASANGNDRALEAARAEAEAAREAAAAIEAALGEAQATEAYLIERVRRAALAVVAAELGPALVATAIAAQHQYISAISGLRWLHGHRAGTTPAAGALLFDAERPDPWPDDPGATARLGTAHEALIADPAATLDGRIA